MKARIRNEQWKIIVKKISTAGSIVLEAETAEAILKLNKN